VETLKTDVIGKPPPKNNIKRGGIKGKNKGKIKSKSNGKTGETII